MDLRTCPIKLEKLDKHLVFSTDPPKQCVKSKPTQV